MLMLVSFSQVEKRLAERLHIELELLHMILIDIDTLTHFNQAIESRWES